MASTSQTTTDKRFGRALLWAALLGLLVLGGAALGWGIAIGDTYRSDVLAFEYRFLGMPMPGAPPAAAPLQPGQPNGQAVGQLAGESLSQPGTPMPGTPMPATPLPLVPPAQQAGSPAQPAGTPAQPMPPAQLGTPAPSGAPVPPAAPTQYIAQPSPGMAGPVASGPPPGALPATAALGESPPPLGQAQVPPGAPPAAAPGAMPQPFLSDPAPSLVPPPAAGSAAPVAPSAHPAVVEQPPAVPGQPAAPGQYGTGYGGTVQSPAGQHAHIPVQVRVKVLVDERWAARQPQWLVSVQRTLALASRAYHNRAGIDIVMTGVVRWPTALDGYDARSLHADLRRRPREGADMLLGFLGVTLPASAAGLGAPPAGSLFNGAYALVPMSPGAAAPHLHGVLRAVGMMLGARPIARGAGAAHTQGSWMADAPLRQGQEPWLDLQNLQRLHGRRGRPFEAPTP